MAHLLDFRPKEGERDYGQLIQRLCLEYITNLIILPISCKLASLALMKVT